MNKLALPIILIVIGIVVFLGGGISGAIAGFVFADDITLHEIAFGYTAQRYNYQMPWTPHETAVAAWALASLVTVCVGAMIGIAGIISIAFTDFTEPSTPSSGNEVPQGK